MLSTAMRGVVAPVARAVYRPRVEGATRSHGHGAAILALRTD